MRSSVSTLGVGVVVIRAEFMTTQLFISPSNQVWQHTKPGDPSDNHTGWTFADPESKPFANSIGLGGPFPSSYPGNTPDPHLHAKNIREIYEKVGDKD